MYPRELGFKMPAEWENHAATFIEWPVRESLCWPENHRQVCLGYSRIAKAIAKFEPVIMLVNFRDFEEARAMCGPGVQLMEIEHNDSWMRDNGPTFLVNEIGQVAGVNWKFNAWGEKYFPWDLDDQVAPKLLKKLGIASFDAPIVLEGGSIHVDGEGTLLTTEECLLNKNRNPNLDREDITELLKGFLGIDKIIWLKRGLFGDETDGHIDNVACFAGSGKVLLQTCKDSQDPNYEISQENLQILSNAVDAQGRSIEIIEIPQPKADYYKENRLTLSYLNFYFVNKGIILPTFGNGFEETDQVAMETLQRVFPDREVVAVDGMLLVREGGNVHCITQQMPSGKL